MQGFLTRRGHFDAFKKNLASAQSWLTGGWLAWHIGGMA